MSSLPPQATAEFQALWKKHHGVTLPPDQAALRAGEVFAVLRLVLEKQTQSVNKQSLEKHKVKKQNAENQSVKKQNPPTQS